MYATTTAKAACRVWPDLGVIFLAYRATGAGFGSEDTEYEGRHYRARRCAPSCLPPCQRKGQKGPEIPWRYMKDDYWCFYYASHSIAKTSPSIKISCKILSLLSGKKHGSKSLKNSLALATVHVRHLFYASGRLRHVRCEDENIKHFLRQYWLRRFFRPTARCLKEIVGYRYDIKEPS